MRDYSNIAAAATGGSWQVIAYKKMQFFVPAATAKAASSSIASSTAFAS